jgi:CHAT domain-containing protein/tetratricopeptide (TPR) repeat protein
MTICLPPRVRAPLALQALFALLATNAAPVAAQEIPALKVGTPVVRDLKGGETHTYTVTLEAGDLLDAAVQQRGIDVVARLVAPDGAKVLEVDSPNGMVGPEPVAFIASSAGTFHLEVSSLEPKASPGRYQATLRAKRPATAADRRRIGGARLDAVANRLRAGGKTDEARAQKLLALVAYEAPADGASPIEQVLAAGDAVSYRLACEKDEFLAVTVKQRGKDVSVVAYGPDGATIAAGDSLNGAWGAEMLAFVAKQPGPYWLQVQAKSRPDTQGRFELRVSERRTATQADLDRAESHSIELQAYRQLRTPEGVSLAERAAALREKAVGPEHPDLISALRLQCRAYSSPGHFEKLPAVCSRALALAERIYGPEDPGLVWDYYHAGAARIAVGDADEAQRYLNRGLMLLERAHGPESAEVAFYLSTVAPYWMSRGFFLQERDCYERSVAIRRKLVTDNPVELSSYVNELGTVNMRLGDYARAEQCHLEALALVEKAVGPESGYVGAVLNNLGIVYQKKGDLDRAESCLERALAIFLPSSDPKDAAFPLTNLGQIYEAKGDFARAEATYNRVLAINGNAETSDINNAGLFLKMSRLYRRAKRYEEAEGLARRTLLAVERRFGSGGNNQLVAGAIRELAVVCSDTGRTAEAMALFRRLLVSDEASLGRYHPDIAATLQDLTTLAWSAGDTSEAEALLARLQDTREHFLALNLAVGSERQRLLHLDLYAHDVDLAISFNIRSAASSAAAARLALETVLRRKGRTADATAASIEAARRRASPEQLRLFDELGDARSELAALTLSERGALGADQRRKRLDETAARVDDLERRLAATSAEYRARFQSVTLGEVRGAIPPDSALVEFAVYQPFDPITRTYGAARYVVYTLSNTGEPQFADLGDAESINRLAHDFRARLADPQADVDATLRPLARELDERVMRPVRQLTENATRLLVSPDGALNLVPFAAFVDEGNNYLIERYAISYLTSGRDLLRFGKHVESAQPALIVANPDFQTAAPVTKPLNPERTRAVNLANPNFLPLPGTEEESRVVGRLIPGSVVLTRGRATKAAVERTRAPWLLHVATHGFFVPDATRIEDPLLRSGLALAGANRRDAGRGDGLLTALEVSGLDLWGTQLVVLSACDTGVGDVRTGEGVYGLRRALVLAGSETQVLSLWDVDDIATRDLMRGYYTALLAGTGRAEALRSVQIKMLSSGRRKHPAYWAGFITSGDWRPLRSTH